jgi:hypothetical protein
MEVITISNSRYGGSTVVVSGYTINHNNQIVLLDTAPMHPKLVGTKKNKGRRCRPRTEGSGIQVVSIDIDIGT